MPDFERLVTRMLGLAAACAVPFFVMAACGCNSRSSANDGGQDGGAEIDVDATGDADAAVDADAVADADGGGTTSASVLQHHLNPSRDGLYVDPALTHAAVAGTHMDPTFAPPLNGPTYAQPLYVDNGPAGTDWVIAATERNDVTAFAATDGAVVWTRNLGTPVPLFRLPCGNIDPLGITGTPVIDLASRTLYVDAMTTPDCGATQRHLIFALAIDDGSIRAGWPVDVSARVAGFDSSVQNQRGALAILGDTVYAPYGGHYGDCGVYHGWVVGVRLADPTVVQGWATRARGGGSWAVGGIASDATSLYIATGNTFGAAVWSDGEAILRLGPGPTFSGLTADYFAPSNWMELDFFDIDVGGTAPVLFDVAGATPSALTIALGKDGNAYLLDRGNLGGVGGALAVQAVSANGIINAAAAYTTALGTYVAFRGRGTGCAAGQNLAVLRVAPAAPPTIGVAWCANQGGWGSPIASTTDGRLNPIVWGLGAEGDNRLHAFDGDTGAVLFGGGGPGDVMSTVEHMQTPIIAKGRIFVAANTRLYAFTAR